MEIAYWVVAGLLALFYAYAGGKKLTQSQEELVSMMGWAGTTVPMPVVRLIGLVEILGAAGLVLPPLVGIATWLAVAAAAGLVLLQVLAAGVHLARGETRLTTLNAVLVAWAAVTVWLATTW